jgi:hypothetical protein
MRIPEKAIVKRDHRNVTIIRTGRGYSLKELKEGGFGNNIHVAIKKGVPVDVLRDTAHVENVDKLRPILKTIRNSKTKSAADQANVSSDKKKTKRVKRIQKNTIKSKRKTSENRVAPVEKV